MGAFFIYYSLSPCFSIYIEKTYETKGGFYLKPQPNQRAVILGRFILENKSTVRAAAKKFGISKSTVHTVIQKVNGI